MLNYSVAELRFLSLQLSSIKLRQMYVVRLQVMPDENENNSGLPVTKTMNLTNI